MTRRHLASVARAAQRMPGALLLGIGVLGARHRRGDLARPDQLTRMPSFASSRARHWVAGRRAPRRAEAGADVRDVLVDGRDVHESGRAPVLYRGPRAGEGATRSTSIVLAESATVTSSTTRTP